MLADISNVDAIYIVCGRTDMRKSIDGLCAIIQEQFSMEIDHALFLFCGRKCDRIKAILKEPDGIVMIYKRLTAQGSYRWPRNKSEVRNLTWREFDWLMSGIDIEQPKANGVNVYHYLTYLLEKLPNDGMSDDELELLAPWNENLKAEIERRANE